MKPVLLLLAFGLAGLAGHRIGRVVHDRPTSDPVVESNSRLTGYAAAALVIPLAAEAVTGFRFGILAHALIGFFLLPLVLLKLGSVGNRFIRYYTGDARLRAAGPPDLMCACWVQCLFSLRSCSSLLALSCGCSDSPSAGFG